jgi:hypothetical protein
MPLTWTAEQILALAPDQRSVAAGQSLATSRAWAALGHAGLSAWGECRGSAGVSYRTLIDLSEPAFRCSCPSRKSPCKHGLGLLLLLMADPTAFAQTAPPPWAAEWLARHPASRAASPSRGVADPVAQSRRAAAREAKVAAGLAGLGRWLRDLVRQGLAVAQAQPASFWEAQAARLVDAQAPGAARLVRELAGIPASGPGWQERLLERLGRLHLLVEAFQRLDALPPDTRDDVRAAIGWTQPQEELLQGAGRRDLWLVLGQRMSQEENLRVLRTWLWGTRSRSAALVLEFAHVSQPLERSIVPGTALDADVVFFPGAFPMRALVKQSHAAPAPLATMPGYADALEATGAYAAALARNPWLEQFPLPLASATPVRDDDSWTVRDTHGRCLPLAPRFEEGWHLLALSGGRPLALFGEWDGDSLLPLGAWAGERFFSLSW